MCNSEMPNGSMMFLASNPQLAEMGREANLRVLNRRVMGRRRNVADWIAVVGRGL
jgi:hypothetical protein